jgi:hypothetical protein
MAAADDELVHYTKYVRRYPLNGIYSSLIGLSYNHHLLWGLGLVARSNSERLLQL